MKKNKHEQAYRAYQYWKLFPNEPLRKIAILHDIAYSTLSGYITKKLNFHREKLQ